MKPYDDDDNRALRQNPRATGDPRHEPQTNPPPTNTSPRNHLPDHQRHTAAPPASASINAIADSLKHANTHSCSLIRQQLATLYWRGSAATRERIEAEIEPEPRDRPKRAQVAPVDPQWVLTEVREFVGLARAGAYMGGDRRVSPKERTRWRFTFQRLAADAREAVRRDDDAAGAGATALELLLDLAGELRGYEYFRSDDPVEAARFVVSDAVALLWRSAQDQHGFAAFAERAMPQLVRWESEDGWTRSGFGKISEKETKLAVVLAQMLPVPDMWVGVADCYLAALDRVASDDRARPKPSWQPAGQRRAQRTADLAQWHVMLLDKLIDSEAEDRLDRLAQHPALGGPELEFLRARLAHRRGDLSDARSLVAAGLEDLPGHRGMLEFAAQIDAPLPPRAQQIRDERSRLA
jgi:uncharacterized protein YfiM (DUF2279 family)